MQAKRVSSFKQTKFYSTGLRTTDGDKALLESKRTHPSNNIPLHIEERIGSNLHLLKNHPLNTISNTIVNYFQTDYAKHVKNSMNIDDFDVKVYDNISPIVTVKQAFDDLLIPSDHVSRSPTDTYYIDDEHVLRCHTSAHQTEIMKMPNNDCFLVVGDVYRRDTIDITHFPVFHQMEGVRLFKAGDGIDTNFVVEDMKKAIENMIQAIFGKVEMRWVDAYFPFTEPSYELEIFYNGEWLETLGCGAIHRDILANTGHGNDYGWAFGFGLERLAMVLFKIPDIRLFWSKDERFLSQFSSGSLVTFKPFSNYPVCYKDISFWIPEGFHSHTFYELVRQLTGDRVEDVKLIDQFVHPKTKRESHCYRLNYRAMDRTLTNEEIDELQFDLRDRLVKILNVELR